MSRSDIPFFKLHLTGAHLKWRSLPPGAPMSLLPIFERSGIKCVDDMGADDNKM